MKGIIMEKDKYLVVGYRKCDPYYDGNTDELVEFGFPIYKEFEYLSDARIYVNNLPDTTVNVRIYELFETYEDDEKEEKEVNNEEEKLDFNCFFQELNNR